ncbi:MAG: lysophospholipid acyltransferase family protein [Bacteroidota bacterium]|nr:lysophospholipid acyltransferase family protein [Bacteroidota bacterium]
MNIIFRTISIDYKNKEAVDKLNAEGKNFIIAFWHGNMLLGWFVHRGKNSAALISKSKDGALLAKLLNYWNYEVIRGSSNEGGKEALFKMVRLATERKILAITPDGPKGPLHKFKPGAVIVAKRTGVPLVLAGISYKKKIVLSKSWDRFEVPRMFSKTLISYSDPFYIDKALTHEETTDIITECEQKLNDLQKDADNYFK